MTIKANYKKGERIFAKIKGFPYWPAKIENIDLNAKIPRYNVKFYGDNKMGIGIKESDICQFLEHKGRLSQQNKKNVKFACALREAEMSFKTSSELKIQSASASLNSNNECENNSALSTSISSQTTPMAVSSPIMKSLVTPVKVSNPKPTPGIDENEISEVVQNNQTKNKNLGTTGLNVQLTQKENLTEQLLESQWLTDDSIKMYYDILNEKIVRNKEVHFLNPSIALAIKCLEDISHIISPLKLNEKSVVFVPVSDSSSFQIWDQPGGTGTHWSLLLFVRNANNFYHFDSMGSTNYEHAKTIAKKITPYLGVTYKPSINRVQTPQQVNTVDCGIYMLIVTDAIVFGIFKDDKINMNITFDMLVKLMPTVEDSDVLNKRAVIALMIHKYQYISMNQSVLKSLMFNKCWEKECNTIQAKYTDLLNQNLDKREHNNKLPMEFNTDTRHTIPQIAEENRTTYLTHDTKNNGWIYVTREKSNKLKNRQHVTNQPIVNNENRYQQLFSRGQEVEDTRRNSTHLYNHAIIKHKKYIKKKSSYQKSNMPEYSGDKIKISLFSDSQGRGISDFISNESKYGITGEGYVASNAHLGYVTKVAQSMKSGDAIVVIGGTNDLLNDDLSYIYKNWEHELAVLSETKPVIITTIPQRFDCQDNNDLVHLKLTKVNNYIRELAARINNVYLVELEDLNRSHHTYHGLHLNKRGKREIVCQIIHKLNSIFNNNPQKFGKPLASDSIGTISAMQNTSTTLAMTPGETSYISIPTAGKDSSILINSKEEDGNLNNPSINRVPEEWPYATSLCNDQLKNNGLSDVNESVILPNNVMLEKSIICDVNSDKCKSLNKSVNLEHERLVERSQDTFLEIN